MAVDSAWLTSALWMGLPCCRRSSPSGWPFCCTHRNLCRFLRGKSCRSRCNSVGQLPGGRRLYHVDVSGWSGSGPPGDPKTFRGEHGNRSGRIPRSVCRSPSFQPLCSRVDLAAVADRRPCPVHDLGRGCLCCHGGNGAQSGELGKISWRHASQRPGNRIVHAPCSQLRCLAGGFILAPAAAM